MVKTLLNKQNHKIQHTGQIVWINETKTIQDIFKHVPANRWSTGKKEIDGEIFEDTMCKTEYKLVTDCSRGQTHSGL